MLQFFSQTEYDSFKRKRTVVVSTVSMPINTLMYRSSDTIDYARMVNWVWASANQPIFMTPVPMDGENWLDGGVKENVPIAEAINYAREHKIKFVDVIVLNTTEEPTDTWPALRKKDRIIAKILRVISIFSDEIKLSDIEIGALRADVGEKIRLRVFPMDEEEYRIAPNSNFFKERIQKEIWKRGYAHIFKPDDDKFLLTPKVNNVDIQILQ